MGSGGGRRAACPSPIEFERGFWSDDAQLRAHAEACEACRLELAELAALVAAGRRISPPTPSPAEHEALRAALLAHTAPPSRGQRPPRWFLLAPAALAIAAAAVVWWQWPGTGGAIDRRPERRGTVLDHGGAGYLVASSQPDEIVRLVSGTLSVEVAELAAGERFRVVTGDAEVESNGAVFDIAAQGDHLISVRVMQGAVEVRGASAVASTVIAGQSWHLPAPAAALDTAPGDDLLGPGDVTAAPVPVVVTAGTPAGRRDAVTRRPSPDAPTPDSADEPAPEVIEPTADAAPTPVASAAQQAFNEGWDAIRSQEFEVAAEAFARAAAPPSDPVVAEDAEYWAAVSLARSGRTDAAIEGFQRFLTDRPFSPHKGEVRVMLGWLMFDRGDHADAERHFLAAVADVSTRVRDSAAEGLKAVGRAMR